MVKDEGYKESKQGEKKKNRRMRVKGRRERERKNRRMRVKGRREGENMKSLKETLSII